MKECTSCDDKFACSGDESCWCFELPAINKTSTDVDCLCKSCLSAQTKSAIDKFIAEFKKGTVENLALEYSTVPPKFIEGIDYYLDGGAWVFLEWAHLKRGFCCGNGCRHCQYPKKK